MTAEEGAPGSHTTLMHDGELPIDEALVARLLAAQLPDLAGLGVRSWPSTGTVNAIFRLGDHLTARLPRLERYAAALAREAAWLPWLAPRLSLRVPEPVAVGRPTTEYPCAWAVYRWLDGVSWGDGAVVDERAIAAALAGFVGELRALDTGGGPPAGRAPLRELDVRTRVAIEAARGAIDADAALAVWTRTLAAPAWDGVPSWIHGDLMRPNLLFVDGRLDAVIDFGGTGVGDPAMDLVAAWSVFGPTGRAAFGEALRHDPRLDAGAWARARGYALHQAALIVPYYADSNPAFAAEAVRIVGEVLGEVGIGSRYREVVRMLPGIRGEIRSTVTRCEPDCALEEDFEGAGMRGHLAYAFVAEGGGTRLVQRQSLELAGWLRPLQLFVRRAFARRLCGRLDKIAAELVALKRPREGWWP